MDFMETVPPIERRSSLELLADAGRARGFQVQIERNALLVDTGSGWIQLMWPTVAPVRKSQIVPLLLRANVLTAIATAQVDLNSELPPWLPCLVKPDLGACGEDHCLLHKPEDWNQWRRHLQTTKEFIVQPVVQGVEFRVTICRNGAYAAARLVGRYERRSLWLDATDDVPRSWLAELLDMTLYLKAPGLGCDIIQSVSNAYLLDVNTNPSLTIHVATDRPRNVAPPFFESWLDLERTDRYVS